MAPSYRISTQTRRGARNTYPEHDDFEGLPVRQWRHEWINVDPPQPAHANDSKTNNRWSYELPHGMPKDWQLLPPHTQDLLRAARSGILYKRRAPAEEDEADADVTAAAATAAASGGGPMADASSSVADLTTADSAASGADAAAAKKKGILLLAGQATPAASAVTTAAVTAPAKDETLLLRVWKQVSRDVESPLASHLAKRRKNTVVLPPKQTVEIASSASASVTSMPMPMVTVAKVRKLDAAGNAYEQTVTLADGQQTVDGGEILSTTLVPASNRDLPPQQQQTTPSRKRNPPPRRKGKPMTDFLEEQSEPASSVVQSGARSEPEPGQQADDQPDVAMSDQPAEEVAVPEPEVAAEPEAPAAAPEAELKVESVSAKPTPEAEVTQIAETTEAVETAEAAPVTAPESTTESVTKLPAADPAPEVQLDAEPTTIEPLSETPPPKEESLSDKVDSPAAANVAEPVAEPVAEDTKGETQPASED
ncbi:apopolysialoglycoprotein-like protein [Grosmannia clavigera kw1407]|uniref:Apopolysialoglycoprotein-like protein n=1 Tax=Grosmannia clavigera (strain kw1407 / UAMH 11150) TaxID=655863 RepID=F0XGE3_GROCL|nr:apopolysialoglycoprotein-like protein [Grosmannia clavigera kw1407]EFX02904.1 apopolysialoglycoprotein-like protein [Grosmannia clavigera kw1407]